MNFVSFVFCIAFVCAYVQRTLESRVNFTRKWMIASKSWLKSLVLLNRLVTKDTQLGDYRLEKGDIVHLVTYLNHTCDRYFPNPEQFDVNRFLDKTSSNESQINRNVYMPFSTGARQCIGMRFAVLELKFLITRVLLNYDLFKPEGFKLEELSRRRFCNPIRMDVGLRKRAQ